MGTMEEWDAWLRQPEDDPARESPNNSKNLQPGGLDLDGMDPKRCNANMSLDPFSNNNDKKGGQGSVTFFNNLRQPLVTAYDLDAPLGSYNSMLGHENQDTALSGPNDHSSPENMQQRYEQHQPAIPSSHNNYSSDHGVEQYQTFSSMLIDGEVEEIVDSIEHGQDPFEEEAEEEKASMKNEEYGSDEEFKKDAEDDAAEEDADDEEDEDGQKKKKKKEKRKPYTQSRILTRWNTSKDQLALLCLIHLLERENVPIPWEELNILVNAGTKSDNKDGGSLQQHLTKVRRARIFFGMPVPPPKKNKRATMDEPKIPSEKETKTFHSLTYTRDGQEDKMAGTPGTMEPRYAPVPIPGHPELPVYDPTYDPPMWPLPKDFKFYSGNSKEPRVSKRVSSSDNNQVKSLKSSVNGNVGESAPGASTEKKGRSRVIVKAEDEDDAQVTKKPARKGKNTPAVSKRKAAAQQDSKATPAKPRGVPKSRKTPATLKKTPATLHKITDSLDGQLDLGATPSKKTTAVKKTKAVKKKQADVPPEAKEMATAESSPVAMNQAEQPAQSYGRVDMNAVTMPPQSFDNMHAGLPSNKFRMAGHQPSQSFDSQSSMSTAPNQSLVNAPIQFMPDDFNRSQNDFAGSDYTHQTMTAHGPAFAHGHGMQNLQDMQTMQNMQKKQAMQELQYLSREELLEMAARTQQQQAPANRMQQQQYNTGYNHANIQTHGHGHGPHGLDIANTSFVMPSEYAPFDSDIGEYGFVSGPARNMPAQQQLFTNNLPAQQQLPTNGYAHVQNDGNDQKLDTSVFSGEIDMTDMEMRNFFDSNQ